MGVTKSETADDHYRSVVKNGAVGGIIGLAIGTAGMLYAQRRYAFVRNLSVPFRTFLVTSSATFASIVAADHASIEFGRSLDPGFNYQTEAEKELALIRANQTPQQKAMTWARHHRYNIVFGSWAASMVASFAIVNRNKYMTAAQKTVQARVYAQALTLVVLVASAALEMSDAKDGSGRWETVQMIDPEDPEHRRIIEKRIHKEDYQGQDMWKDMVAAEERRMKERKQQQEQQSKANA